jgi:hypothetical protein
MTKRSGLLVLVFVVVAAAGTAIAGTWSDKVNYRFSQQTSIKIIEPEGFKVTVTLADGSVKVGTVPELFTLPDADAFVKVTITPTDGSAPWSKKVEVRAKQQTELAVAFKPDAPKGEPAKPSGRGFFGRMINQGGGCGRGWNQSIKVEFLRKPDRIEQAGVQIAPSKNVDVELPGASYTVVVQLWNGKEWKFVTSSDHELTKDGWRLAFGCQKGSTTPVVLAL